MSRTPHPCYPGCRRVDSGHGYLICDCQPGLAIAPVCQAAINGQAKMLGAQVVEAPPTDEQVNELIAMSRYRSLNDLVRLALHKFAGQPLPKDFPNA